MHANMAKINGMEHLLPRFDMSLKDRMIRLQIHGHGLDEVSTLKEQKSSFKICSFLLAD